MGWCPFCAKRGNGVAVLFRVRDIHVRLKAIGLLIEPSDLSGATQVEDLYGFTASKDVQGHDRLVSELTGFGLTPLQARVYMSLLRLGSSKARSISQFIDVNRVDVYRVLRELSKRGLVEVNLASPAVYTATRPKLALQILLSEAEERVRALKERSGGLLMWLSSVAELGHEAGGEMTEGPYFKLVSGHQIVRRCMEMFGRAKKEVLRVVPGSTILLHFREEFLEHYKNCVDRGVRISVVTEIDKRNMFEAEEFSKIVEVRHSSDVSSSLKYIIVDDSEVMVMVNSPIQSARGATAFVSNNQSLIRGFKLDFESLCKSSEEASSRIRELKTM